MTLLKKLLPRKTAVSIIADFCKMKNTLDYSRFPTLEENEIEEQYIKGSGPGGSKVNKTANCVLLKHIPTGIVIKCQKSRLLQENCKLAREHLLLKLDELYNGDMSISAQKKRISLSKKLSSEKKKEKMRELKKEFYSRENSAETL